MTERIILELKSKINNKRKKTDNIENSEFLEKDSQISSILDDIDLTLQSLNYPKKEIKNLLPVIIKDIKNKNIYSSEKNNISFENLLKAAMNLLEKNNSNLDQ